VNTINLRAKCFKTCIRIIYSNLGVKLDKFCPNDDRKNVVKYFLNINPALMWPPVLHLIRWCNKFAQDYFNNAIKFCQVQMYKISYSMDQLLRTGQNRGRVFNFRSDCVNAMRFLCYRVKLPNLKLKTRPKQLLGSLPLDTMLPGYIVWMCRVFQVRLVVWQ